MAGNTNGALGVQVAHPDRTVVVGCGDGCYNLSGFELMTAVEHNLPVIWVIFDDAEFKLIKLYQLADLPGHRRWSSSRTPTTRRMPEPAALTATRVETLEEFEAAFDEALASRRPSVIDATHHPLGDPPLQPLAGRRHRRHRRDGRGEVARPDGETRPDPQVISHDPEPA